uniref:Neutrophil cytosolic factor 1-like n=1 Tax=Sinocyclocheilus anshuiensis TaxID=1608454 RepID=A0A671S4F5_9TELE
MAESYVRHVEMLGFEKRFFPSQHYVYMLLVKWNDQSEKLVYRRYPEIHTFHKALKEMFPIEAGDIDGNDRIIPTLPAPKWLDNQKTTETRQVTLAEYFRSLLNLPPKISRCQLVCDFFKMRPEDETPPAPHPSNSPFDIIYLQMPYAISRQDFIAVVLCAEITGPIMLESYRVIADYSKSSKYELSLKMGDMVDIVEKSPNGWWFCQYESRRGWVPASYLEPLDGADESEEPEPNYTGELYKTTKGYKAVEEDELTLEAGEIIEVIHKLLDGWWVVRKGEDTGFYPSLFLCRTGERKEVDAEKEVVRRATPPPRRSTIRNAQSIHPKGRQRISQDTYRRQSRRFLQQRGRLNSQSRNGTRSPLQERKTNRENIAKSGSPQAEDLDESIPVIPPRPSPQLILERCTENTCKRVSIHEAN